MYHCSPDRDHGDDTQHDDVSGRTDGALQHEGSEAEQRHEYVFHRTTATGVTRTA